MNQIDTNVKIKRILVSQPEPANNKSPFFDLAKKNDIKVDFRPFIHVEGVSAKEFKSQKIKLQDYSSVIFTSRTAVDHFFRISDELKVSIPEKMKYFCITESTAFYLQKYIVYRKRRIFYGNGKFDDLIDVITKNKKEKFLLPVADTHKQEITRKLKKHKLNFKKAVLYKTVNSDLSDLANVNYDILVFYSPSGIRSLLKNFPDFVQNNTRIASFGTNTAKAVKDAGLRLDIKAPMPKAPSMTMAIESFIQTCE